ncbi:hypothetical protein DFR42_103352 [Undibacterium pigrum]|uniref:Uncharacterized protein n=1 Tax=Undibacterium pigrum TaxID=401470 RepID=A0A318JBM2_9BURK|nr:hypothetical protein DFR42_103352 [Undibacterium pigrum]
MNERSFLFIMDMVRTQGKKNLQGVVKVLVFFPAMQDCVCFRTERYRVRSHTVEKPIYRS